MTANFSSVQAWGDLVYQSLTMFDENLRVAPALAESWTNPNPTTWIFKLRQGVRFHDGSELEAADVVSWHERIMDPATAAPYRDAFDVIQRVEPRDRYTVQMTLAAPHAPLLTAFAAMRGSAIVPRRWAANGDLAGRSVGTGPFQLVEYAPRSHLRYVKHRQYWEPGLPYLDDVTLKIMDDEGARVEAVRSGQVKYAFVQAAGARQLAGEQHVRVLASPGPSQRVHNLNVLRKPFDDVRVRQAVALAIDRRAAIETSLGGHGRLTGPIPAGHGGWALPSERLPYSRDPDRAERLLIEAGYPYGFRTVIKTTSDAPSMLSTSIILADWLRDIGIDAEVRQMDWATLVGDMIARDYDILSNSTVFSHDPDGYMTPKYHSRGAQNASQWSDDRYDVLVDRARTTTDSADRKRLYDQAQTILLDESPVIWWFAEDNLEAIATSQKGYVQSFTGRRTFLKTVWVDP